MADLPKERLRADLPPFSNVGVDYFGPFETKRGRSQVKRYGVIFTCMTSRAVHLEMAHSLNTDSCIDALRRFIARRGQVLHIRSDNGTNLVGAKRVTEFTFRMEPKQNPEGNSVDIQSSISFTSWGSMGETHSNGEADLMLYFTTTHPG